MIRNYTLELVNRIASELHQSVDEVVADFRDRAAAGDEKAAVLVAEWESQNPTRPLTRAEEIYRMVGAVFLALEQHLADRWFLHRCTIHCSTTLATLVYVKLDGEWNW